MTGSRKVPKIRAAQATKAQREQFLELIRQGKSRFDAARAIGQTGTRMRSLCRHDRDFAIAYEQARTAGQREREDWLRDATWIAAERGEKWALEMLAKACLPEMAWLRARTTHVEMTGQTEVTHVHVSEDAAEELRAQLATVVDLDAHRVADQAG